MIRQSKAMKCFVPVIIGLALVSGCKDKVKKETRWDAYQEPIEAGKLPEDSGVKELAELWTQSVGGGGESVFTILKPTYYQGGAYAASRSGFIYRFDAQTGDALWKTDTRSPIYAGVGVNEDIAVAAHDNGDVVALNAADGEMIWKSKIKRQISSIPAIGKGRVIIRTADGFVMGLDAVSGRVVWQVKKAVPGLSMHGDSTPTITGDAVLVGLSSGRMIANNVINGRDYWETEISYVKGKNEIERLADADTSPMVVGTTVFAGTYQGSVVAVQLQNAKLIWRKNISTRLPLAVTDGLLAVTAELGRVFALDASNGDILWQQDAFQGHGVSQPVIIDDRIVIGDRNGNIHVLDADSGNLVETKRVVSGAITGIIQTDRQFTVTSSEGRLATLSL